MTKFTDDQIVKLVQQLRHDSRANSLTILAAEVIEDMAADRDRAFELQAQVIRLRSLVAPSN